MIFAIRSRIMKIGYIKLHLGNTTEHIVKIKDKSRKIKVRKEESKD